MLCMWKTHAGLVYLAEKGLLSVWDPSGLRVVEWCSAPNIKCIHQPGVGECRPKRSVSWSATVTSLPLYRKCRFWHFDSHWWFDLFNVNFIVYYCSLFSYLSVFIFIYFHFTRAKTKAKTKAKTLLFCFNLTCFPILVTSFIISLHIHCTHLFVSLHIHSDFVYTCELL